MASRKPEPVEIYNRLYSEFIKKYGADSFHWDKLLSINGNTIRLVFPESDVAGFFSPPFTHIGASGSNTPDLQILCLRAGRDFRKTASKILPGMFDGDRRDIPFLSNEGITVSAGRESNSLSLLNRDVGKAVFLFDDFAQIPPYERGSPFKAILQWWFDTFPSAMLHSASVGFNRKAVLIGGRGGTGKTSTALACRLGGLDYIGDDYVIVSGQNEFCVSSVYNSAKLTSDSFERFPGERQRVINPGFAENEKGVLLFSPPPAGMAPGPVPLFAIVFPEISGREESSCSEISPSEGFRRMAPSTVFQHIGRRNNITSFVSRLTKGLPCYKLSAGKDQAGLVLLMKKLTEGG